VTQIITSTDRLLTDLDAARLLRVSASKVAKLRRSGDLAEGLERLRKQVDERRQAAGLAKATLAGTERSGWGSPAPSLRLPRRRLLARP
jgi:hypothetical protein